MDFPESPSFEDEILALNPEYDLVFGKNNDNFEDLRTHSPHALEPQMRISSPHKMRIISKMNEIINTKPIGELPAEHDWEDNQSIERETITLMRKLGIEPSFDRPPNERMTIATVPVNEDVILMKNGRKKMSIFMSDNYFELKPKSEPSFDLDDGDENVAKTQESVTSDYSDDVHLYQPIYTSTQETDSTSLSALEDTNDTDEEYRARVAYQKLDSLEISPSRNHQKAMPSNKMTDRKSQLRDDSRKYDFNHSGSSNYSSRKDSSSSSAKSRSNNSWRSLNDSSFDERDENNWRLPAKTKIKISTEEKSKNKDEPKHILNETITIKEETSQPSEVSNCGSTLYKPKDLFLKKKALMLQQATLNHFAK